MKRNVFYGLLAMVLAIGMAACSNGTTGGGGGTQGTPDTPKPFNDITATQLVANIKIGWNLGSALDATDFGEGWIKNASIQQMETCWNNPVTTKAMITAVKNAGFNAIRIPVTWTKAVDSNYNIRKDWMNRVVEVVNYAVDNDMYILLDTHHDDEIFTLMNSNTAAGQAAFKKIWEQIADTFKNYNEKLVFEALNEPRTKGSANEWNGGTAEERNNLNRYYQIFVDTVRASGGNNGKRILQVNTYGTNNTATAVNGLVLPNDTVPNKLIVSIHHYDPGSFAQAPIDDQWGSVSWSASNPSDVAAVTSGINTIYNTFASKGIPVIIGEFAALNKNNEPAIAAWAKYLSNYAWNRGIKCFWWDSGVGPEIGENYDPIYDMTIFNRRTNTFKFPQIVAALMEGTTGTPTLPAPGSKTITINPNDSYGYQTLLAMSELGASVPVASGSSYTLTYTFTSNVSINDLKVFLVDSTEATNWWNELSGRVSIGAVSAGTPVSGTKTINATGSASGSSNEANRFALAIDSGGAASTPTLTFTTLTLKKN